MPLALLQTSYAETLAEVGKNASLPGFRAGATIPPALLVKAVGESKIKSAALENALQASMEEAMACVSSLALKDSERIVTPMSAMAAAFSGPACAPAAPLVYEVEVETLPDVTWASPYAALRPVAPPAPPPPAAAAEAALQARLRELAELRVVAAARGLQAGDVARIDLSAKRAGSEELILSMQHRSLFFDTLSDGAAFPALVQAMTGMAVGETRDVDLAFPATWDREELRNVPASFRIALSELFTRSIPALDDSLAPQLAPGCATLAEARAHFARAAEADGAAEAKAARSEALLAALAAAARVAVPPSLFEEQGRQSYSARLLEMQKLGQLSAPAMRTMMSDSLVNAYLTKEKASIEALVTRSLAIAEVARAEALSVDPALLEAQVAAGQKEFEAWGQEGDVDALRAQAEEVLLGQAVIDWLAARAVWQ